MLIDDDWSRFGNNFRKTFYEPSPCGPTCAAYIGNQLYREIKQIKQIQ